MNRVIAVVAALWLLAGASMPANAHHYGWAKGPTIVQVHGMGPFALTYVNPDDDPRNKKK